MHDDHGHAVATVDADAPTHAIRVIVQVITVDLCGREGALSRVTLVLACEVFLDLCDVLPPLVLGCWQNSLQKLVEVYTEIVFVFWV